MKFLYISVKLSINMEDSLRSYINKLPGSNLTIEDEKYYGNLLKMYGMGSSEGREAYSSLMKNNLRLVVKIAHDFKGSGVEMEDLISKGNLGLHKAVLKYDPEKGAKFSSYASWWIKQHMRRELTDNSYVVRRSNKAQDYIRRIWKARIELEKENSKEPTLEEIAEKTSCPQKIVKKYMNLSLDDRSLDAVLNSDDGENNMDPHELFSQEEDWDEQYSTRELISRMYQSLDTELDENEKYVVISRYGMDGIPPQTLREISSELGFTRERVRQLQNRALRKLRERLEE